MSPEKSLRIQYNAPLWSILMHDSTAQTRIWCDGYEVLDGWKDLAWAVAEIAEGINREAGGPLFMLIQAKEKWGEFYIHYGVLAELEDKVGAERMAEYCARLNEIRSKVRDESNHICENCGERGAINREESPVQCRCPNCANVLGWGPWSNLGVELSGKDYPTETEIAGLNLIRSSDLSESNWLLETLDVIRISTCIDGKEEPGAKRLYHSFVYGVPRLSAVGKDWEVSDNLLLHIIKEQKSNVRFLPQSPALLNLPLPSPGETMPDVLSRFNVTNPRIKDQYYRLVRRAWHDGKLGEVPFHIILGVAEDECENAEPFVATVQRISLIRSKIERKLLRSRRPSKSK